MNLIQTVLAFLLALGPLIVFHELGHYLVARLCGVKVLRFSVGMGKVVWSRRVGPDQTEWALSALPLGGYVKMLDNRDPETRATTEEEARREFTAQNVWRRIAIIAAGPAANFLLAIVLFAALYMVGVAEPSSRLRFTPENSVAFEIGLRAGDRVTAVNGNAVGAWSDLRWEIIHATVDKEDVRMDVERPNGERMIVNLPARALAGMDVESDLLTKLGMSMARPKAVLGRVLEGGPAARGGLQAGDLVTAVDGKPVVDGIAFIDAIRATHGESLAIEGVRNGEEFTRVVTPELDATSKTPRIMAEVAQAPDMVTISAGPITAVAKGARRTWETSVLTVKMIGKMIIGEVSWKNVTGPITIADYAGQTARLGVAAYLSFIAFISVSLGVMNLLPIPVLDGGHLLYYSLEVLTGRPIPERVGEFAQRAGIGLLVMLMALAVFNDVVRLL
ncbi:MAG: RIP metalloprotease RseP [Pseudomonadota bacterium]